MKLLRLWADTVCWFINTLWPVEIPPIIDESFPAAGEARTDPRPLSGESPGAVSCRAAPGHTKLLLAAANQLRDWAAHPNCESPNYCRMLARQLEQAGELENRK